MDESIVDAHFEALATLTGLVECTDHSGVARTKARGLSEIVSTYLTHAKLRGTRVFAIGNGGSTAIASHFALDLTRVLALPASSLAESAHITCLSNDLGYDYVYSKQLEVHARQGDLVVCISSSGRSSNICNAAVTSRQIGCDTITLSGFEATNPLRSCGDINFYVPSQSYGAVEVTHLTILHAIIDLWPGMVLDSNASVGAM